MSMQGQKVPGRPSPGRSTLGESFSDRDDLDLDEALLQAAAEKKAVSREKSKLEVEARKTMFVHVRLNRVHCRVTYQVLSAPRTSVKAPSVARIPSRNSTLCLQAIRPGFEAERPCRNCCIVGQTDLCLM